MSLEMKTFGAFVWQLARYGVRQAVPLAIHVRHPGDSVKQVRQEIRNDVGRGLIDESRAKELKGCADLCLLWHKTYGHVEERPDCHDWASLGEGAHMRVKHLDENYETACGMEGAHTYEERLSGGMENEED